MCCASQGLLCCQFFPSGGTRGSLEGGKEGLTLLICLLFMSAPPGNDPEVPADSSYQPFFSGSLLRPPLEELTSQPSLSGVPAPSSSAKLPTAQRAAPSLRTGYCLPRPSSRLLDSDNSAFTLLQRYNSSTIHMFTLFLSLISPLWFLFSLH